MSEEAGDYDELAPFAAKVLGWVAIVAVVTFVIGMAALPLILARLA
jgi:hypothetical protein